jgi:hypothetical protein
MRMATMTRFTLAALTLLAGCGQDIDLGGTRTTALEPNPTPTSSGGPPQMAPCPFDDPALLQAPPACPTQLEDPLYAAICVVSADGRVQDPFGDQLLRVPGCPVGVYFTLAGSLPPADNIERSVAVLKADQYDKPALDPNAGLSVPRTIETLPARASFFVRFDPRPSAGLRINVLARHAELFAGRDLGARGGVYGFVVGFLVGDLPNP